MIDLEQMARLLAFPVFGIGLVTLMGQFGWRTLAQAYPATSKYLGERWPLQAARLPPGLHYPVTLGADADGLHIFVFSLFRLGHPPVVVPWADVAASQVNGFFVRRIRLEFLGAPGVTVEVSRRTAERLRHSAGSGWSCDIERAGAAAEQGDEADER